MSDSNMPNKEWATLILAILKEVKHMPLISQGLILIGVILCFGKPELITLINFKIVAGVLITLFFFDLVREGIESTNEDDDEGYEK